MKPTRHAVGQRVRWYVRVGKRLSGLGKPERKYFHTRKDAVVYINQLQDAQRRLGEAAFTLSFQRTAEAVKAFAQLDQAGTTLTDVLRFYFRHHPKGKLTTAFADIVASFLAARALSCKARTLATYRSELAPALLEFGPIPLHEILQSDIEEWAVELDYAPRTRANILDTLTSVFEDAVRKGQLVANPAMHVPRPPQTSTPPGILLPTQARQLLSAAQRTRPYLVPALAIALFAGLRRSELCALSGKHILAEEGLIEVPAGAAKTRQRRLVTIRENLRLWLVDAPKGDEPLTHTRNSDVFGAWLSGIATEAGILSWPHNAMRHSFASYLLALIHNEGLVAAEMGNTPNVIVRHYRAVVRPAAARDYFAISPHEGGQSPMEVPNA